MLWQAGPYLKDVKIAANAAADYFDSVENVSRSQVVVFDIDETTLSNLPVRPFCRMQSLILVMHNSGWAHMVPPVTPCITMSTCICITALHVRA